MVAFRTTDGVVDTPLPAGNVARFLDRSCWRLERERNLDLEGLPRVRV